MESWTILPDAPLDRGGRESEALRSIGCETFRDAARWLHELPYGRNTDRADFRLVLVERRGTCSTKHALLASVAAEQRIAAVLTVGVYDMSEANTPGVGGVLAAHGLASVPEAHCYLRFEGRRIDVTRSGVSARAAIAGFHREWAIEPAQIGAHKVALHRDFLAEWLRERRLALSLEDLWEIREACIAALGEA